MFGQLCGFQGPAGDGPGGRPDLGPSKLSSVPAAANGCRTQIRSTFRDNSLERR
jgi:hypothetical protein